MISQEGVNHKLDPLSVLLDLTKSKSLSTNTIFDVQTSDVSRDFSCWFLVERVAHWRRWLCEVIKWSLQTRTELVLVVDLLVAHKSKVPYYTVLNCVRLE